MDSMTRRSLSNLTVAWALASLASCAAPTSSAPQGDAGPQRGAVSPNVDQPASPPANDPFAAAFVDAHNLHRAQVSPPADPPLPPVRWSEKLAAVAQAVADRCKFEHSDNEYGENLSARTDRGEPAAIVASWAGEAKDYDHKRNRCAPGAVCGHYTQVVWRKSTAIGCAVARCPGAGPFGGGVSEWFLGVCNYSPPGNFKGERPY
jgi:pathogenesis-related protein 1